MSKKNNDRAGRWRCKTIAFRVSPEEYDLVDDYVRASGLSKQEYLINNMLKYRFTVRGSSRVFYGLKKDLEKVLEELQRIGQGERIPKETLELIAYLAEIVEQMQEHP